MKQVLALAKEQISSGASDLPVAAILVKDSQVIAKAVNTRELNKSVLEHAEINVIKEANKVLGQWNLSGASLYVNLEPCPMCAGAILQSHISELIFGAYEAKSGAFGSRYNLATKNLKVIGGLMEQESKQLLQDFFRDLRN